MPTTASPARKWTARIVIDYSDGRRALTSTVNAKPPLYNDTLRGTGDAAIEEASSVLAAHDDPTASARVWMDKHLVTGTTRDERQYAYLYREGELGELVYVERG